MIISLSNLRSTNDGASNKQVFVFAVADATGGLETLNFTIIDQQVSQDFHFQGGEAKEVSVSHRASGTGEVAVKAAGSTASTRRRLNVDKVPGDDGTGA
jgi:hypothetical protein